MRSFRTVLMGAALLVPTVAMAQFPTTTIHCSSAMSAKNIAMTFANRDLAAALFEAKKRPDCSAKTMTRRDVSFLHDFYESNNERVRVYIRFKRSLVVYVVMANPVLTDQRLLGDPV